MDPVMDAALKAFRRHFRGVQVLDQLSPVLFRDSKGRVFQLTRAGSKTAGVSSAAERREG